MKRITQWQPDTCDCVLLYEWDDEVDAEQRVHTPVHSFTRPDNTVFTATACVAHSGKLSRAIIENDDEVQDVFGRVSDENKLKNEVLRELLNSPELAEEATNSEGDKELKFKRDCDPKWSFDQQRRLCVDVKGSNIENLKSDIARAYSRVSFE